MTERNVATVSSNRGRYVLIRYDIIKDEIALSRINGDYKDFECYLINLISGAHISWKSITPEETIIRVLYLTLSPLALECPNILSQMIIMEST